MLIFFYGGDSYSSAAKTRQLREKFLASHPASGLVQVEGSLLQPGQLVQVLEAQDLWSGHRLVVIHNLLADASAQVRDEASVLVDRLPENTTVLVHESQAPDKRLKLFTKLTQIAKSQDFVANPAALLQKLLAENNTTLDAAQRQSLVEFAAGDPWLLATELEKISSSPSPAIAASLIGINTQLADFALQDAISNRSPERALQVLKQTIIQQGGDTTLALGAIAAQLRTIILLADNADVGASKIHPFVIRKLSPLAKSRPADYWISLLRQLSDYDWKTKTGALTSDGSLQVAMAKLTSRP